MWVHKEGTARHVRSCSLSLARAHGKHACVCRCKRPSTTARFQAAPVHASSSHLRAHAQVQEAINHNKALFKQRLYMEDSSLLRKALHAWRALRFGNVTKQGILLRAIQRLRVGGARACAHVDAGVGVDT